MKSGLHFEFEEFNKLFPFYLIIDSGCNVVSVGKSFLKITNIEIGAKFQELFEIRRPFTEIEEFKDLIGLVNQLVFFGSKMDSSLTFRGQFEFIKDNDSLLFVGSPWFYSMDNVREKHLTLADFAIHDPMMDLLHVLKTAEMASDDLKQLVKTIDKQKQKLKEASKEINDIALFPKQNPDPLIRINKEGEILAMNPAAERIEYLIYNGIKTELSSIWKRIIRDIETGVTRTNIEAQYEGIIYSFVVVDLPEYNYFNIYGRDITSQKKYEEDLLKLSLVADKTSNTVVITDKDGYIEWVNSAFERLTGYTFEEVKGMKPGEILQGPNTDPISIDYIRECLKKQINFQCEILNYAKSGKSYWIKMNFQPIKNRNGELVQYFAIQDDITDQKKTQEILTRREEKYRSIISNINLGLLEVDLDERILLVNQSLCDIFGYEESELIGKKTSDLFLEKEVMELIEEKQRLRSNKISDAYEIQIRNKQGERKFLLISGAPLFNDNGTQIGSIGIHLDITDRKEQEEKMKELLVTLQQVNQELNDFAYIVSHDLKAPLRAIGSLATWLEADYSDKLDLEGQETLKLLVQRTQRMHNLIEGILNYSRLGRTIENLTIVKTNELVLKIIDILSPPNSIQIKVVNNLPNVVYEEVKLQQVFQNLISNAIKFMDKPQGIIEIEAIDNKGFVEFFIKDNGPGIESAYFEKIFQIFQTLKARDEFESTGIGLTIVKKIVENFGGTVSVTSQIGKGSIFRFTVLKH